MSLKSLLSPQRMYIKKSILDNSACRSIMWLICFLQEWFQHNFDNSLHKFYSYSSKSTSSSSNEKQLLKDHPLVDLENLFSSNFDSRSNNNSHQKLHRVKMLCQMKVLSQIKSHLKWRQSKIYLILPPASIHLLNVLIRGYSFSCTRGTYANEKGLMLATLFERFLFLQSHATRSRIVEYKGYRLVVWIAF